MPIYEFECSACGDHFERLQKLSDTDPTACPKCGAERIKRRLTAPAFRLAGKGWYETDFKKDGDKKRNLAAKDEAPKADAKTGDGDSKKTSETAKTESNAPEKKDPKAASPKPKSEGAPSA
jgi:putative FmdB family regulatory protein